MDMRRGKCWTSIAACLLILAALLAPAAQGGAPDRDAATAGESVRRLLDEVLAIQNDPRLQDRQRRDERRQAIKSVIARSFHFDGMARQALGKYDDGIDKSQRAEFLALFQDLFQDSYTKLVLDFLKRERIVYDSEEAGADRALIRTRIVRMSEEIPVEYALTPREGKWLVQDVKIDGVSITENYRRSFARVIQRDSFQVLLDRMRLQRQAVDK
ncbi:MAG: ABC transporter substrate-binding protein [Pseudomonadota bacterium]|nr:ABC transporter substrate-binding protein [Pseudomonadota bacterium]